MITSLGLKTIRRSNKIKWVRFSITEVSLKKISNIIKDFKYFTYEGYARNSSKYMPTDSYFYLERHISKCTINFRVPVRTKNTSTQNMSNYKTSKQMILN